nr:MAG TPA: hypothetical protein [Caudoviricetes sp.]
MSATLYHYIQSILFFYQDLMIIKPKEFLS